VSQPSPRIVLLAAPVVKKIEASAVQFVVFASSKWRSLQKPRDCETAGVSIADNGGGGPQRVSLSGTGT